MTTEQIDMFPDQLKSSNVAKLANDQLYLVDKIEQQEKYLAQLKEELREIQEVKLPTAMNELGLAEIKLENGAQVKIKPFTGATISNKEAFFDWLDKQGFGSLVKHKISCTFGKGDSEESKKLLQLLSDHGYSFEDKQDIHSQTLNAFIAEQDRSDNPPSWPGEDTIKIYRGQRAMIKKG